MNLFRWLPGRLYRKYAVYFVALVSAALLASGGLGLYFSYRETGTALYALQREKAQGAVARIEEFMREIEQQIGWSHSPAIRGTSAQEQRYLDFLRLLRQAPAVTEASWLDAKGFEQLKVSRLGMDRLGSKADFSSEVRFLEPRKGATWFSPVYFHKETEPYMTIAMPSGRDGGVTVAEVNLKFVWDVVSRIQVGASGYAYVVNASGQLVSHPDISLVLQKTDFSALPQVRAALVPDARTGEATSDPIEGRDRHGKRVLAASASLPTLGWVVFVEQPLTEAYAPLYAFTERMGLLLLAGLVLAVLASLMLAGRMVTPIRTLQTGASKVGAGALDYRIELRTGDEIEALGEEFNRMAARLQESYADLEHKVAERTQELAVANRHKSEFLANMSHELRTPLNAIIGFSQVLKEKMFGDLNPKQAEYVGDIHDSGKHLLSLINDILDLSKVEAGRMELEITRFNLPEALRNACALVKERAARHDIALALEVDPKLDSFAGDERKLKQIMLNLLSNAVKFTPDGGRIEVRVTPADGGVQVVVRDSGIGIAPEDQEKVFEEFRQVGRHEGRSREGTGLGLPLARRFVELHGGALRVDSALGKGSTFSFTLREQPWPMN